MKGICAYATGSRFVKLDQWREKPRSKRRGACDHALAAVITTRFCCPPSWCTDENGDRACRRHGKNCSLISKAAPRPRHRRTPSFAFDIDADYLRYVDGKPAFTMAWCLFSHSRGIELPLGFGRRRRLGTWNRVHTLGKSKGSNTSRKELWRSKASRLMKPTISLVRTLRAQEYQDRGRLFEQQLRGSSAGRRHRASSSIRGLMAGRSVPPRAQRQAGARCFPRSGAASGCRACYGSVVVEDAIAWRRCGTCRLVSAV